MNNASNIPDVEPGIPSQNAMSVYGQHNDAMDDFPVLKAFQQYVNEEHAKAQKRMTTVCVFFAFILAIIVGVFVSLIVAMGNAKNEATDKLLQYMFKERESQQALTSTQNQNAPNDAAYKALTETVSSLQKQLAEQQVKLIEEKQRAADEAVKRANEAAAALARQRSATVASGQSGNNAQNQKENAEIAKAKALLKQQQEALAKEKERLRQQEIELHRRRLYPEYYRQLDEDDGEVESAPLPQPAAAKKPAAAKGVAKPKAAKPNPPPKAAFDKPKFKPDGSIRYFDDDDDDDGEDEAETKVTPVTPASDASLTGKGASAGWTIPLD